MCVCVCVCVCVCMHACEPVDVRVYSCIVFYLLFVDLVWMHCTKIALADDRWPGIAVREHACNGRGYTGQLH